MNITAFINAVFRESGILRKFMMVMKITSFILLIALMQVSAAGLAQKISLNEKNMSLKNVIEKVRQQSGYNFLYIKDVLDSAKPININVKNADFKDALNEIFANQPFDYVIQGKNVIIRKKATSFLNRIIDAITADDITITGKVVDEKGQGLPGATMKLKGDDTNLAIVTSSSGAFSFKVPGKDAILVISYVGYKTKEVSVSGADVDLVIRMEPLTGELEGVTVVSTGYQNLPKERATGSFEQINNELFNRNVGTNIIPRLEGITNSLIFNKQISATPRLEDLSIRGVNTLTNTMTAPLIVLDNFPYSGNINDINPNDVENITVLKDAAAASIWGARSGNGVIVITTKKGKYDQPENVSFNTNVTLSKKPDLFYYPRMSSSDFIDVERMLFANGFYDDYITYASSYGYPYLSPVVDILVDERDNVINPDQAKAKIDALRKYDVRNDYNKYIYRNPVNQQYALNLSGGSKYFNYFISGGYDKATQEIVNRKNDRITLKTDLTIKPIKHLELQTGLLYTQTKDQSQAGEAQLNYSPSILPYTRLADEMGNPLIVGRGYRAGFLDTAGNGKLLDWKYRPLSEINSTSAKTKIYNLLLNLGATYRFDQIFSFDVKYQYGRSLINGNTQYRNDSYYTRNLINLFTDLSGEETVNNVPLGDILDSFNGNVNTNNLRGQFNINKIWDNKHELNAIIGAETRQERTLSNTFRTYGYNDQLLSFKNVNTDIEYPLYVSTLSFASPSKIPSVIDFNNLVNRNTSIYANAAYSYDSRYTISASARKDASNLYGVKTNQKGVPLWSVGLSWDVSRENFFRMNALPYLRLRTSYGYQGNTNNALSAYSLIRYATRVGPYHTLPYASIVNPANADLRWEKVGTFNIGVDFRIKDNLISGSVEFYSKKSKDLLTVSPIDRTTGFTFGLINRAELNGRGVDLQLHSNNLTEMLKWTTDFLFSYNTNSVKNYISETPLVGYNVVTNGYAITPVEGRPVQAIYSYKWAGLDPNTGAPMGYVNGTTSKDYNALLNSSIDDLNYNGSAVPVYFGSFRNTFSWRNISLSANVIYKLGYYFRRAGVNYSDMYNGLLGLADFNNRWKVPGDESKTNVPAMIYPAESSSDSFYNGSSVLVERGDHIRLQDITLSYNFQAGLSNLKNIKVFATANNLGIIWKANKHGIDPDFGNNSNSPNYPAPLTFAFGLSTNF